MSNKPKARVVYDPVIARYFGEVVRGDELIVAFCRNTREGAIAAARAFIARMSA